MNGLEPERYYQILIKTTIDGTTLVLDDNIPDEDCHTLEWETHMSCNCSKSDGKKPVKNKNGTLRVICKKYRIRWLKDTEKGYKGIIPTLIKNLLDARKNTRKIMESIGLFLGTLMQSRNQAHIYHLQVQGVGSYAAHTAMGAFYDEVGDLVDAVAESYQGVTETLLTYPTSAEIPQMKTAEDCVNYLRDLYEKVHAVQETCPYSEIKNELDNIKTLINSTKYKLIFLK
jgi:DNA-binding ferritin-like protein